MKVEKSIVFLSGGQGSQFEGMAISQYENDLTFHETVNNLLSGPILSPIKDAWLTGSKSIIFKSAFSQPLLIAIGIASARSLVERGINPNLLLGHSAGEFALASFAGLLNDDDIKCVLENRFNILNSPQLGSMLAVRGSSYRIQNLIQENQIDAWIAAENSPTQCLISGESQNLEKFTQVATDKSLLTFNVNSDMPFHSPLVKHKSLEIKKILDTLSLKELQIEMISASTANWISEYDSCQPEFWANQIWKPVKFWSALDRLFERERIIIDLGPGKGLSAIIASHPSVRSGRSKLISLMPNKDQSQFIYWENKINEISNI